MSASEIVRAAITYIDRNFAPVPVKPRGKGGMPGWDKITITREDAVRHFDGNRNIGLRLGALSKGLLDIDLDCSEALLTVPAFLPSTDMVSSRSSKPHSHFFYRSDLHQSDQRASVQYKDVDGSMICEVRIGGGAQAAFTCVWPSTHPSGERIVWEKDGEPSWVDQGVLKRAVGKGAAAALLARHWPAEGGRHDAALTVDGFLARSCWSRGDRRHFIETIASAAGDDDIRDRMRTSDRTDQRLVDNRKISGFPKMCAVFTKEVAKRVAEWLECPSGELDEALERMNGEYAVVMDGGRTRVLRFDEQVQTRGDGRIVHRRMVPTLLQFGDFYNFHLGETVAVVRDDGKERQLSLGHWWAKHPQRRKYAGLIFRPNAAEVVGGRLNLWRGWGVEPIAGDWSLMQRHVKEVVAAGNDETAVYTLNWLAWAVQHPAERAQVALVLKGGRGTGKGTLGNAMCRMFGQHATHISSVEHLAGRFNAHLRDACLLFADEAYWPGDKHDEGTLKRLITEPTLFIEAKGRDGVTVENMLHVIMASNSDWVVPAGEHERRYAVFQVSEEKRQDESWFTPLYDQMENGGYSAMLHDLLKHDLSDWHPRRIPITQALREQQVRTLEPLDAWVIEFFETGLLPEGTGDDRTDRPDRAVSHSRPDFEGRNPRNGLFDLAKQRVPSLRRVNDQVLAAHLKRLGCKPWRSSQLRGWEFPPLVECRRRWEEKYPDWPWEHPEITEWQADGSEGEGPEY